MLNKKFKLLPLACFTLCCINFGVSAAESTSLLDGSALKTSNFFKDSKIDFSTVNKFQYLDSNDYPTPDTAVQTAWAQGISAHYQSGYIGDILGVDASYTGVLKLAASNYFFTRQYLYSGSDTDGDNLPDPENYSKFDQLYLKQKFGTDQDGIKLFEGYRQLNNFGAIDSLKKVSTTDFYGYGAEIQQNEWTIRAAYLTSYSNADTPYQTDFKTGDGKVIDYVATGDISYKNQNGSILYYVGDYKDYLLRHGLEITSNQFPYIIGAQFYVNQAQSDWKDMSAYYKGFDNNAYHLAIDLSYINGPWFNKAAYAYTIANKSSGLGKFLLATDNMTFNSMAHGLSEEFFNNREHFLGYMTMYQINPSYASGVITRFGYGEKYQGNHMQDIELAFINKWTPTQVQNLSAFFGFGPNWTFKRGADNTPYLDSDGNWIRGHGFCITSSFEYKF